MRQEERVLVGRDQKNGARIGPTGEVVEIGLLDESVGIVVTFPAAEEDHGAVQIFAERIGGWRTQK